MSSSPIRCDADALLRAMMKRDLSVMTTASLTGISRDVISKLIRSNCAISLKTAKKLQEHFGDDVIIFEKEEATMIQDMTLPREPRERFFTLCKAADNLSLSKAMREEITRAEAKGYELTGTYSDLTGRTLSAILKFELVKTNE